MELLPVGQERPGTPGTWCFFNLLMEKELTLKELKEYLDQR
jgi:hypothetical protein